MPKSFLVIEIVFSTIARFLASYSIRENKVNDPIKTSLYSSEIGLQRTDRNGEILLMPFAPLGL